ncbi:MAG TPA: HAD hydrolase family protein [Candidatus Polarisedimenticolia bacterium]|nr:HAD hydrolase family protein [Candidatus Polarisedimenticolia bacterium]
MRCRLPFAARARRIELLLLDVDGVMTDGRIIHVGRGDEARCFDVKDGVGLWLARSQGLRTGIISGRASVTALRRASELRMDEVHLEARDKLKVYERILARRRLTDASICYVGDDLVDLPVLRRVGLPVAVADAHPEILRRVPFVTEARGGRGAIREVIDAILAAQGRWTAILERFDPPRVRSGGGRARPATRRRDR